MNKDLKLTGTQFNLAATVRSRSSINGYQLLTHIQMFFLPYAAFEIPSNIVLKMMRPSRWLALLVVSWGTV